ncbi:MAG: hypothetical protein M2R45_02347 [Verrucomicrobia subdivision 3 bacterium]|nr:hypothetical protein [Limisphaerales bacterium]MCS1414899.1 hypothetical protein [Limisphaerales bacterium]
MNQPTPINTILTHPGSAHKDEFLACSVLAAHYGVPIIRREPSTLDLENPQTCIVDIGGKHEPANHNFDHHQFPKDHPPICSLSLVLRHLGLYEQAKQFCDWLEPTEWFDCRGAIETAQWLGVPSKVMSQLNSPIDITVLRKFATETYLKPGDTIWEIMRIIGQDLLDYVKYLRIRLSYIEQHGRFWTLNTKGQDFGVFYLPRTNPPSSEPSSGLEMYINTQGKDESVAALIYPDRRGTGYGLSRFNDDKRLDFTLIGEEPDVHFAHARGFVAKTTATNEDRLRQLVSMAWIA